MGDEGFLQHPQEVLCVPTYIITAHLVFVIQGLHCKKAKVEVSHLRISENINVQVYTCIISNSTAVL